MIVKHVGSHRSLYWLDWLLFLFVCVEFFVEFTKSIFNVFRGRIVVYRVLCFVQPFYEV